MSLKNSYHENERARFGTRFINAGDPSTTTVEVRATIKLTKPIRVEYHFDDGVILANPTVALDVLHALAIARSVDFRIVLVPAESIAFANVNVYHRITHDEQVAAESVSFSPQHLNPKRLFEILTSGRPITLRQDDYLHRLPEIKAALAAVTDPAIAKEIGAFAEKVETYKAGELKVLDPKIPLTEWFGNEEDEPLQVFNGTVRRNYIPKLQPPEIAGEPRVIPYSRPLGIKVPDQPRVPFKIVPSPTLTPPTEPPAKAKPAPTEPEERSLAQPGQTTMAFDC